MELIGSLLNDQQAPARFPGVAVGIVTNNQDPQGLGRVKVRFPWLSDNSESHWARIAAPMAGRQRGFFFLPEVDDEVLVAFEHGMIEYAYIVGGLWNGGDKPPVGNGNGKNDIRTIQSRSGHIIRFDDGAENAKIEIQDGSGKQQIVLNMQNNTVSIVGDADITITSRNGKVILSGNSVEIKAQGAVKVEAGQTLDLQGGAQANLKGGRVNIN